MNKEQAFAMIEQAKVRVLTDEECDELGAWADSAKAESIDRGEGFPRGALIEWITQFTKGTRPTADFATNFKKIQKTVMPHVVKVFEQTSQAELTKRKDG